MFIYMYTSSLGPPVLHAALAPCMNNAVGSRASQGGLACILWPHHESCMHLLAPSWIFKPETPTCMSLAMTSSGPKAFIPWFRQNSAGIKVLVRTTVDFLWNLEFGGMSLVVQRIWRNFVNSVDGKTNQTKIKKEPKTNQGYFMKIYNLPVTVTKNECFHRK